MTSVSTENDCPFSASFLQYLTHPPSLCLIYKDHLDLAQNRLEGALPEALYDLTDLGTFQPTRIRTNQNLSSLITLLPHYAVTLRLASNRFASTISDKVGNLTKLESLLISDNFLDGSLPETIGQLSLLSKSLVLVTRVLASRLIDSCAVLLIG